MSSAEFHRELGKALGEGWIATAFAGSVIAGFLLGYLADAWLGTEPWLVITGIVAGSASGFYRMMAYARGEGDV